MSGVSSPNSLIDKRIGSAYPAVLLVAENIAEIKHLSQALNGVSTSLMDFISAEMDGRISAAVSEEVTVLVTDNLAFAQRIESVETSLGSNSASILSIQEAFTTHNISVASQITELESIIAGNKATIDSELETLTTANLAMSTQLTELAATVGTNKANVDASLQTLATDNLALSQSITNLSGIVNSNYAGINTTLTALSAADEAMTEQIISLTTLVNGNRAEYDSTVQTLSAADLAFTQSITALSTQVDTYRADLTTEQQTRSTETAALALDIASLTTRMGNNESAISVERQSRIDAVGTIASEVTTLLSRMTNAETGLATQASAISAMYTNAQIDSAISTAKTQLTASYQSADTTNLNSAKTYADTVSGTALANAKTYSDAALNIEIATRADAISAVSNSVTALTSRMTAAEGTITSHTTAISNVYTKAQTDSAITTSQNTITAAYQSADTTTLNSAKTYADAAVSVEALARANAVSAVSTQLTTVESTLNGNIAAVQTSLSSDITAANEQISAIGARYTAKLTVNGLIGGFEVYNNGASIDAGFDVDYFYIGRTLANQTKPFYVDSNIVYMDTTIIRDLAAEKLTAGAVGGDLKSVNYSTGSSGWRIGRDGVAEFQDIIARGDIEATSLNAATGTFAGTLMAGVIDPTQMVGQTFTYTTPGTYAVTTLTHTSTVKFAICGGGGGGAGGRGNTADRCDYSGYAGNPASAVIMTLTNVPAGATISTTVASGGAGGINGGTGSAGGTSSITLVYGGNTYNYYAAGGNGGTVFRANDNPDSGLHNVAPERTDHHTFRLSDAGDGGGGRSGQCGLAVAGIPNSSGGLGGFYGKERTVYWGGVNATRQSELNGQNGVNGGGGGGGIATRFRAFSKGSIIGYRSVIYDNGGNPESNGGNGGNGYARIEVINPNAVVLTSVFDSQNETVKQNFAKLECFKTLVGTPSISGGAGVVWHYAYEYAEGSFYSDTRGAYYQAGHHTTVTSFTVSNSHDTKKLRVQLSVNYTASTDDTAGIQIRANGSTILSTTVGGGSGVWSAGTYDIPQNSTITLAVFGSILWGSGADSLTCNNLTATYVGFVD